MAIYFHYFSHLSCFVFVCHLTSQLKEHDHEDPR